MPQVNRHLFVILPFGYLKYRSPANLTIQFALFLTCCQNIGILPANRSKHAHFHVLGLLTSSLGGHFRTIIAYVVCISFLICCASFDCSLVIPTVLEIIATVIGTIFLPLGRTRIVAGFR